MYLLTCFVVILIAINQWLHAFDKQNKRTLR